MTLQPFINFAYKIILKLVHLNPVKNKTKTVLIVKTNEIGDYILWRPVLKYIQQSEKFKTHKIFLVGNIAFKSLFDEYDIRSVDKVFWVNMKKFKKNLYYRYQVLKKVYRFNPEIMVNTVISRCQRVDDAFTLTCKHAYKIGTISDLTNVLPFEKGYDYNLFNEKIDVEEDTFEFYKNKLFTEKLIHEQLPENLNIDINVVDKLPSTLENIKYFVVFPGASRIEKTWSAKNFSAIAHLLVKQFDIKPVLCGSIQDKIFTDAFLENYKDEVINLTEKTNLQQFAVVLKHAEFLISVDTGAVHLCAAIGGKAFCVFNGTRYARFLPYPEKMYKNVFIISPNKMDELTVNEKMLKFNAISSYHCDDVPVQKVFNSIKNNYSNSTY